MALFAASVLRHGADTEVEATQALSRALIHKGLTMTRATSGHPFWQHVLAPPPAAEHDAADMGTCFGLEMSLGEPAPPCAATTATSTSTQPGLVRAWLTRFRDDRRNGD